MLSPDCQQVAALDVQILIVTYVFLMPQYMGLPGLTDNGVEPQLLAREHGPESRSKTVENFVELMIRIQREALAMKLVCHAAIPAVDAAFRSFSRYMVYLHWNFPFPPVTNIHTLSSCIATKALTNALDVAIKISANPLAQAHMQLILLLQSLPRNDDGAITFAAETFYLEFASAPRTLPTYYAMVTTQLRTFNLNMPKLTTLVLKIHVDLSWNLFRNLPLLRILDCYPTATRECNTSYMNLPRLSVCVLHFEHLPADQVKVDDLLFFICRSHLPLLKAFTWEGSPFHAINTMLVNCTSFGCFLSTYCNLQYLSLHPALTVEEDEHHSVEWLAHMGVHKFPGWLAINSIQDLPDVHHLQVLSCSPMMLRHFNLFHDIEVIDLVLNFASQDSDALLDELLKLSSVFYSYLNEDRPKNVKSFNIAAIANKDLEPIGVSGVFQLMNFWDEAPNIMRSSIVAGGLRAALDAGVLVTHYGGVKLDALVGRLEARIEIWRLQNSQHVYPDNAEYGTFTAVPYRAELIYDYRGYIPSAICRPYSNPATGWIHSAAYSLVDGYLEFKGTKSRLRLRDDGTVERVYWVFPPNNFITQNQQLVLA